MNEGVRRVRNGRMTIGFEVSSFFWELLLKRELYQFVHGGLSSLGGVTNLK
jgi:hypothetical protein